MFMLFWTIEQFLQLLLWNFGTSQNVIKIRVKIIWID